ncbi:MAG TPA: YciI family protein [Candidatus Sulfotelmatobacter sp.]|nr:YciI family protein [Candidatus Sulfotelmatobacter sp.]
MSEFVYLYRGGETDRSPEQAQKTMQKWMTWMKELGAKGHIKDQGQPLERSGKLVRGKQKSVTDGPFTETKDVVGGYTLIEARDLDQAVELSKGCPIFEVDGAVEVRPVMKMNM